VQRKLRLVRVAVKHQRERLQVVVEKVHTLVTRFALVSKVVSFHLLCVFLSFVVSKTQHVLSIKQ
jgi:hypothetical protein